MKNTKIVITAFTLLFGGALLTACGGDQERPKAVIEEPAAKVAEKKIEKKDVAVKKDVVAETKPSEKVAKKPTEEQIAEAKKRQMQEVEMTIASAKGAMSNAAQAGFEWTIWKKMIAKAEAALKEGNAEKAAKISYKIIKQSDAALKQSIEAEKAAPRF